jgi:hypothetical protein
MISDSKRQKRSFLWNFYDKPVNSSIKAVKCVKCFKEVKYENNSTKTLIYHLKQEHNTTKNNFKCNLNVTNNLFF